LRRTLCTSPRHQNLLLLLLLPLLLVLRLEPAQLLAAVHQIHQNLLLLRRRPH
jgi:hypothetical protein